MTATELTEVVHATTNTKGLADLFRVTERTVMNWRKAGMPARARGRYRISDVVQWRLARLEARSEPGLAAERLELLKARRQRLELENAKTRSEVIDTDLVASVIRSIQQVFAVRLEGLARDLVDELTATDDAAVTQALLADACRDARKAASANVLALAHELSE